MRAVLGFLVLVLALARTPEPARGVEEDRPSFSVELTLHGDVPPGEHFSVTVLRPPGSDDIGGSALCGGPKEHEFQADPECLGNGATYHASFWVDPMAQSEGEPIEFRFLRWYGPDGVLEVFHQGVRSVRDGTIIRAHYNFPGVAPYEIVAQGFELTLLGDPPRDESLKVFSTSRQHPRFNAQETLCHVVPRRRGADGRQLCTIGAIPYRLGDVIDFTFERYRDAVDPNKRPFVRRFAKGAVQLDSDGVTTAWYDYRTERGGIGRPPGMPELPAAGGGGTWKGAGTLGAQPEEPSRCDPRSS